MLTISISSEDLISRLQADLAGPWHDRVKIVQWDMQQPLPASVAETINMVVIGHYWEGNIDWSLLGSLPNLDLVQLPSAGFEHAAPYVPSHAVLCNGRGVHSAETAELALGLILAMQRGIAAARDHQREHRWAFEHLDSLIDRRIVLVGHGSVGQAIAKRLRAFDIDLVIVDRNPVFEDGGLVVYPVAELATLVTGADILVLAVPLNDETYHLVDDRILSALPDGALVVNVARGRVVDQVALVRHLQAGRIRAAVDVTTPEPLPPGDPLWDAPNVLITPHQGGNTNAGYPRFAAIVRRQINHLLNNEPLENVVIA